MLSNSIYLQCLNVLVFINTIIFKSLKAVRSDCAPLFLCLERISHKPGTNEPGRPPGDIRPRPGTERARAQHLERIEHKPGTKRAPGRNTWKHRASDQERASQGHTWRPRPRTEQAPGRPPGSIRPRPGTERARAQPGAHRATAPEFTPPNICRC